MRDFATLHGVFVVTVCLFGEERSVQLSSCGHPVSWSLIRHDINMTFGFKGSVKVLEQVFITFS